METIIRNVGDLNQTDRSALERVIGHAFGQSQQIVIRVMAVDETAEPPPNAQGELPEWTDVYQGLSKAEVDDLDAAIRERSHPKDWYSLRA